MIKINVGQEFYHRLTNRDEKQGDGKHTAVEFRERYLKFLDSDKVWKTDDTYIIFDFKDIKKMGPSFANEAFGFFTRYAKPKRVLNRIKFINITKVKELIIQQELESGYKDR